MVAQESGEGGYDGPFKLRYRSEYDKVPALRWQVDKILPKSSVVMLYGEPKNGKTYVSLALALAVLTGTRWCGFVVERADTVYISPEGYYTLLRRQDAWQALNYGGEQAPLPILRDPVNMLNRVVALGAADAILGQGLRPGFIVIDTLQWAALGASASDDNAMKTFFDSLAAFRRRLASDDEVLPTVLLVHHTRKADDSFLGSQIIYASVDGMILCKAVNGSVVLSCPLGMRDAEAFDNISLVFDTVPIVTDAGKQSDRAIVSTSSIFSVMNSGKPLSSIEDPSDWRAVLYALQDGPLNAGDLENASGLKPYRFEKARKGLVVAGKIRKVAGTDARSVVYMLAGAGAVGAGDGIGSVRSEKIGSVRSHSYGMGSNSNSNSNSNRTQTQTQTDPTNSMDTPAEPQYIPQSLKGALTDDEPIRRDRLA